MYCVSGWFYYRNILQCTFLQMSNHSSKLQGENYSKTNKSLLSQYCISEKHVFLDVYTKLQKVTIRFVTPVSVCLNGTTWFPLEGFS
jgi:hypothetical protein